MTEPWTHGINISWGDSVQILRGIFGELSRSQYLISARPSATCWRVFLIFSFRSWHYLIEIRLKDNFNIAYMHQKPLPIGQTCGIGISECRCTTIQILKLLQIPTRKWPLAVIVSPFRTVWCASRNKKESQSVHIHTIMH